MQYNSVHSTSAGIFSLTAWCSQVPYFDCTILRAREHPFAVLLKADGGHVAIVTVIVCNRLRIVGIDLKQAYLGVASRCQELLVASNLKLIDLRLGKLQRSVADATCSFPEPDIVVVSSGR